MFIGLTRKIRGLSSIRQLADCVIFYFQYSRITFGAIYIQVLWTWPCKPYSKLTCIILPNPPTGGLNNNSLA